MKNVVIKGGQYLKGNIQIPPSKSLSHRAIIAAGLAHGKSFIDNLIYSVDINATIAAMEQIGSKVSRNIESAEIIGNNGEINISNSVFQCEESGSTLRFLIPIAIAGNEKVTFTGKGALIKRPLTPYFDIFKEEGIEYEYNEQLPLNVSGSLKAGKYSIPGNISSQFISGLLFILPLLDGDSELEIQAPFESKDYVTLTIDVLKDFGIIIEEYKNKFIIKGKQSYKNKKYTIEGDYSQIAFWLVAGLLNGEIEAKGMKIDSNQGDREVLEIIERMKGNLQINEDSIIAKKQDLKSTIIDGSQCPDIIPVLTVLAAITPGQTKIINASRLRIKECDRLNAIATELNTLGADIKELEDGLIINGKAKLNGGKVKGWNDHRIVMSLAVASLACESKVYIEGSDAITKSYPHFWEHFKKLGGIVDEWHLES